MEKEGPSCDSDTSEELPDLFPKNTFDIRKLKKNEIVWAEYRDLPWPALVRSVDKKNKRVSVWYLDSPGKCFTLPFKKIHDFCDDEFSEVVHKDAKLNPSGKKHHEVYRRSLLFIYRKSCGFEDNPADFFDTSKPYFLLKDLSSGSSKFKSTSENASTERGEDNVDNLEESSEGESLAESDEESRPITKFCPELYVEDSPYDDEMVDKILFCIKAGHVDDHLLDVLNCKIVNERHDLYMEAMKTCNKELLSNSPPDIPINNQEKLHNVSLYLSDLYERKIGKGKPRMTEYVVSVWLPEAVNKAISLIEADSLKQPIDSSNCNESNLPLKAEALEITVNSISDKLSCSPNVVESLELPIDCGSKVSSLLTEVKSSELPVDCGSKVSIISPKVQATVEELEGHVFPNRPTSLLESESSYDSTSTNELNALKILSSSVQNNKKKYTGRKKRKGRFKSLTSPKKLAIPKMTKSEEVNLATSTLTANASKSEASS